MRNFGPVGRRGGQTALSALLRRPPHHGGTWSFPAASPPSRHTGPAHVGPQCPMSPVARTGRGPLPRLQGPARSWGFPPKSKAKNTEVEPKQPCFCEMWVGHVSTMWVVDKPRPKQLQSVSHTEVKGGRLTFPMACSGRNFIHWRLVEVRLQAWKQRQPL